KPNSLRTLSAATNAAMTSIIGKTNKYGRSSHLRCSSLFSRAASGSNSLLSGNMTGRGGNKAFRLRLRGRKFTALEHHVPPPLVAGYEDEYRRRARTHRAARREVCGPANAMY